MPRLEPLPESALDDLGDALQMTRERLGFVPNSMRIMATELEASPLAHGRARLAQHGWDPTKHLRSG